MTGSRDELVIRVANESDVPALVELRVAWTGEGPADPGFAGRFAEWFARERAHRTTWVAFAGERPLGMVSLVEFRRMPQPGRPNALWGYVGHMFVCEDARNRGLGTRLLGALIGAADERGYVRLVLSPSPRAVPFFQRAGFSVADESSVALLYVRPGPDGSGE